MPESLTNGTPMIASAAKILESVELIAKVTVALRRATASLHDNKAHRRVCMNFAPVLWLHHAESADWNDVRGRWRRMGAAGSAGGVGGYCSDAILFHASTRIFKAALSFRRPRASIVTIIVVGL